MYLEVKNNRQIKLLTGLAKEIWWDYFGPMVGTEWLPKIIDGVQSETAIVRQISEGYHYYLIYIKETPVGYFAYRVNASEGELFLSKLYIISSERSKGCGKKIMHHLEAICARQKISKIRLTVFHKNKKAIEVYESQGFQVTGPITRDLGKGIIINDCEMEKTLMQ